MQRTALAPLVLSLFLAAMGSLGCVNPSAGDTSATILYAYDDANKAVLAWNDVNEIYNAGPSAVPQPDRTITGPLISNLTTLAWGGMTVNTANNALYLIDENGTVVRISNASSQNGALTSILDINTFTLGTTSTNLSASVFSQAGFDTSTDTLYVSETGSNGQCRIWVVSSPEQIAAYTPVQAGTFLQNSVYPDTGGTGVAAGAGACYGYFTGGDPENDLNSLVSYTGPRTRLSSGGTFMPSEDVMIGPNTEMGDGSTTWGTLGFDTTSGNLYIARNDGSGFPPVMLFTQSQFTTSDMNSAPQGYTKDTDSSFVALRVITHARIKDWLAGIDADTSTVTTTSDGTGLNNLYLWKGISQLPASEAFVIPTAPAAGTVTYAPPALKALAMDGSN